MSNDPEDLNFDRNVEEDMKEWCANKHPTILQDNVIFILRQLIDDWDASIHNTEKVSFQVQTYIDGFDIPWGMVFLPNQNLIVSDRNGSLWLVDYKEKSKNQIRGVPNVRYKGQGGLLDVEIHPDFINNNYLDIIKAFMYHGIP